MKVNYVNNTAIIELVGEISFNNAQDIRQKISNEIRPTDKVAIVNLCKVDFVDSAGLSIFITLLKLLKQRDGHLILEYPQLGVQRFLEMTRLDELMEIRKCEEHTTGSWPVAKK